jgi:hypothetical protein
MYYVVMHLLVFEMLSPCLSSLVRSTFKRFNARIDMLIDLHPGVDTSQWTLLFTQSDVNQTMTPIILRAYVDAFTARYNHD